MPAEGPGDGSARGRTQAAFFRRASGNEILSSASRRAGSPSLAASRFSSSAYAVRSRKMPPAWTAVRGLARDAERGDRKNEAPAQRSRRSFDVSAPPRRRYDSGLLLLRGAAHLRRPAAFALEAPLLVSLPIGRRIPTAVAARTLAALPVIAIIAVASVVVRHSDLLIASWDPIAPRVRRATFVPISIPSCSARLQSSERRKIANAGQPWLAFCCVRQVSSTWTAHQTDEVGEVERRSLTATVARRCERERKEDSP